MQTLQTYLFLSPKLGKCDFSLFRFCLFVLVFAILHTVYITFILWPPFVVLFVSYCRLPLNLNLFTSQFVCRSYLHFKLFYLLPECDLLHFHDSSKIFLCLIWFCFLHRSAAVWHCQTVFHMCVCLSLSVCVYVCVRVGELRATISWRAYQ